MNRTWRTSILSESRVDGSWWSGRDLPLRNTGSALSVTSGSSSLSGGLLLLLLLDLLGVAVEEHVDHNVPSVGSSWDRSPETEDLSGEQPPDQTDGVTALVVGGDGDIHKLQRSIGIAKGDNGDVDVGRLSDSLVVNTGVGDDDQAGLLERTGDVVGEGTRGETASDRVSASVGSVLKDRTVTVWASGDDTDIVRVVDGSDDTGGQNELLPGLSNVQDVDT